MKTIVSIEGLKFRAHHGFYDEERKTGNDFSCDVFVELKSYDSLEDNIYDLAIAWHVFEHIPADKKAISEIYRLLKPNGKFLISVPIYPVGSKVTYEDSTIEYENFEEVHGHYDHCRSCGLDYYLRFETVGFNTNTLHVKDLDKSQINYFGLKEDHVVWCFTKVTDVV